MDTRLRQYNQEQKLIEWAKKITERQESGMPIEKWCRERGISKQTYYRWQKRVFEAAQRQQQVEFAEVRTSESLQLPATGGSECEKGCWKQFCGCCIMLSDFTGAEKVYIAFT